MPKQALESLTESMFYLLMALTQGERCGTEITAFAAEITAGRVKIGPATLYTLLGKFEKEGLIAETSVLGCKRYYQITPAGRAAYTAECTRLQLCLQSAAAAAQALLPPPPCRERSLTTMTKARCKTLWQPIPCPLSDIEGLESWLGDMAAQGLVPVTIGQNFARFRSSQPKAVRYRLNAKPAPETFLESAPGTPDGEERTLAQECGWYYVTAVGDFFLYACEDSDAPELNTDPQVQALSLRYAKRQVFAPAGLLAYWLVTFWVRYAMGVWHTPVIDFVTLGWLSFCYLGLLAAALASVVHNTVLLYRFSARLKRGAEPERHKNWRKGAGRYLVGRVLAALLFVLTIVWTFAGSAMEKSRHGSIPLEDYTAPLPFAALDDYAGQPVALDADAAPAASFVLVQRLPLAPTFIKYEAHGQAGANGLRGALYVEYYECITPQLARTMYREGKTNGLHNFPETVADAANGSIYCRTLVDGNKVLRVLLFQYQEEQIPLQELEAICKSGFAASGKST